MKKTVILALFLAYIATSLAFKVGGKAKVGKIGISAHFDLGGKDGWGGDVSAQGGAAGFNFHDVRHPGKGWDAGVGGNIGPADGHIDIHSDGHGNRGGDAGVGAGVGFWFEGEEGEEGWEGEEGEEGEEGGEYFF